MQHDHPQQLQWIGEYSPDPDRNDKIQDLDKTDVQAISYQDRIEIKKKCVLMRASEWCTGVHINVFLPPQVKAVIIRKYGQAEAYCFFQKRGSKVYPGCRMKTDPFRQ